MLELRPCCECCGTDLPADSADAFICTFECTFCRACAEGPLRMRCPNCGDGLAPRPRRSAANARTHPPSAARKVKPGGCPPL